MSEPTTRIWHQSFTVLEDLGAYAETLDRHARSIVRPTSRVDLHGMRPGTYPSDYPGDHIKYLYLQRRHTQQFVDAALRAQDEGYDAYFIATIPDIGFEDARSLVDIPVVAYGQASLLVAATLGNRVGIVSFIEALRPQLVRNAQLYGLGELLGPVVGIDASFNDVTAGYSDPAPLIEAFERSAREAISRGANVLVPGEGPLNVFLADNGIRAVDGTPVVDSIGAGLKLCELRIDLARTTGLAPGRNGLYYAQPPREVVDAVHDFYDPR